MFDWVKSLFAKKEVEVGDLYLYGDPIEALMHCYNALWPEKPVVVYYVPDVAPYLGPSPEDMVEDQDTDSVVTMGFEPDLEDLGDVDWTQGALVAFVKKGNTLYVMLDWESPPSQTLAVLQELLPRGS